MKLFAQCEGSKKYVAIPLYLVYIGVFTLVPIYPIVGTMDEAKKLMEPYGHVQEISEFDMEEFFEPLEDSPLPPFEYMMMLARQEKARKIRETVSYNMSNRPKTEEQTNNYTPITRGRVKMSAVKDQ